MNIVRMHAGQTIPGLSSEESESTTPVTPKTPTATKSEARGMQQYQNIASSPGPCIHRFSMLHADL